MFIELIYWFLFKIKWVYSFNQKELKGLHILVNEGMISLSNY